MSDDLSSKTALVFDHGDFIPLARRLAKEFGRVLYFAPWEKSLPVVTESVIGDGFEEIERCDDIWKVKSEVDCFIFPDIYHSGLQSELRSQGFPVWGAGDGMKLETDRQFFLEKLEELGLDVPEFIEIVGITNLRIFLKDKKDIYIKVSKYRGSFETSHWRSYDEDGDDLDLWAVEFGGVKELIHFLCFPKIETDLEIGGDSFCVNGQWPDLMLHGIEKKSMAYFGAVTKKTEMPEELTRVMDAFSPFLKESRFACQWSMEVRVTDTKAYFIDATCRGGLPSTGSQILSMKNLGQVLYEGANGNLVQPEYEFPFMAECLVSIEGNPNCWGTIKLPEELNPNFMASDCCLVNGQLHYPFLGKPVTAVGWLVSGGNTPVECAKEMNRLADLLPDGADAAVESLADIIREIESEKEQGIHFTDLPLPDPEIVLEES